MAWNRADKTGTQISSPAILMPVPMKRPNSGIYLMNSSANSQPGIFKKLITILLSIGLLVVGFMFSLVIVGIVAVLGLIAWAYLYWKTRGIRQAMKNATQQDGSIIEGEASVVREDVRQETVLLESRVIDQEKPADPGKQ
jgi:hypothetical protein